MLTIRTLGTLELLDSAGRPLHRVMGRDKRVALLLYLLCGAPPAGLRRDLILPIFWPEKDAAHARSALRQALHLLRSTLGDDVVVATNSTVGINRARLTCDAIQFELLIETGRPDEAVQLYGGPFLEGFFIAGAQQFEKWVESKRRRLEQRMLSALVTLAGSVETEYATAIRLLTRAQELAPFQDDIVYLLMQRHVAAHNPALALAAYEALVKRLEVEIGVDASEHTRMLAKSIRRQYAVRTRASMSI